MLNLDDLKVVLTDVVTKSSGEISLAFSSDEGELFINENEIMKAASVIKLPILIESFRQFEQQKIDIDAIIKIENAQKVGGTGVINYLTDSNTYSFRNLLELMMIVSDNTASNIALKTVGMDCVNKLSEEIGCANTKFERFFMDFTAVENGYENKTTAADMMKFLKVVGNSNVEISDASRHQMLKIMGNQQFTSKIPGYNYADSGFTFYNKTGELPGIEHDISIIQKNGKTAYLAILTKGWPDNVTGKKTISLLGKEIINYMNLLS
ncbi:serine hydrolase [Sporosarcina siberiensis]|uniref:Serine hydrolase n=1 Tax=Sporosarcina siberiensis TaxID=1365606 RepID=A0ABW4SJ60_9BACL